MAKRKPQSRDATPGRKLTHEAIEGFWASRSLAVSSAEVASSKIRMGGRAAEPRRWQGAVSRRRTGGTLARPRSSCCRPGTR